MAAGTHGNDTFITELWQIAISPVARVPRRCDPFWEPRRVVYNLVLVVIALLWLVATWPHFRVAMAWHSILLLSILALLANVCYCVAYLVDIPMQRAALSTFWSPPTLDTVGDGNTLCNCCGELLDR